MPPMKKRKKTKTCKSSCLMTNRQLLDFKDSSNTFAPIIIDDSENEWVTLNMKLLDWEYMDFQMTLNINTNLECIKKVIMTKHGQIKDIKVYKGTVVTEENEMNNDKMTLKEYGLIGGVVKDDAPCYTFCYNFKPKDGSNDPVLLSWMG